MLRYFAELFIPSRRFRKLAMDRLIAEYGVSPERARVLAAEAGHVMSRTAHELDLAFFRAHPYLYAGDRPTLLGGAFYENLEPLDDGDCLSEEMKKIRREEHEELAKIASSALDDR